MLFLISASFTRPTITCDVMPPSVPASVAPTAIIRNAASIRDVSAIPLFPPILTRVNITMHPWFSVWTF